MGQSVESLSPEMRAEHYRHLADATFLKAQRAPTPEQRAEYLGLATSWHMLASELERMIDPERIAREQSKSAGTKPEDAH